MSLLCEYFFLCFRVSQIGAGSSNDIEAERVNENQYPNPCESDFNGSLEVFSWVPTTEQQHDVMTSINPTRVEHFLKKQLVKKSAIRYYISVKARFVKNDGDDNEISSEPYFSTECFQLTNLEEDAQSQIQKAIEKILLDADKYEKNGSGWIFERVQKVFINIGTYRPLKGKAFIPLPKGLNGSQHGIINIQNNDNLCFVYSILAALHPVR